PGPPGGAFWVAFNPRGPALATAGWKGLIQLWDPGTGRELLRLRHEGALSVAFHPQGGYLASGGPGSVRLWEATTGKPLAEVAHAAARLAFSPDGARLAGCSGDSVCVWDVAGVKGPGTTLSLRYISAGSGDVLGLAFSPDGRTLATAGADSTVRLRSADTGAERAVLRGHEGRVEGLAFHPSGGVLYSGAHQPGVVKVWDLTREGEPALTYRGPSVRLVQEPEDVEAISFTPGGRLAVLTGDRWLRLVDCGGGRPAPGARGRRGQRPPRPPRQ